MICRRCGKEIPEQSVYCMYCGAEQIIKKTGRKRGNGQGCAVKRGKTWAAVWTVGVEVNDEEKKTKQLRRWVYGFPTKSAALAYAASPPAPTEEIPEKHYPTVEDYYNTWLDTGYKDLSKNRQCASRIAWKRLESLADRPIRELKIKDLQAVVDDQTNTFYPARDCKTVLSHVYKLAEAEGEVYKNLSEFIHLPPLDEKESKPFTVEEVQAFWNAAGDGDRMAELILLMCYTGMMPGELRICTVDMINTELREIVGCGIKTKKRKDTPIVYPEILDSVIADLIATTTSSKGYIIGMNIWLFYDKYHEALARIGVRDLPPYSCRHTMATALAEAKVPPTAIQQVMRHTKFATTQRYIHPDMESAHKALETLQESVDKNV